MAYLQNYQELLSFAKYLISVAATLIPTITRKKKHFLTE